MIPTLLTSISGNPDENCVNEPLKEDSVNEPLKEDSVSEPLKEDSVSEPLKEDSVNEPLKEDSVSEPLKEDSVNEPSKENSEPPNDRGKQILRVVLGSAAGVLLLNWWVPPFLRITAEVTSVIGPNWFVRYEEVQKMGAIFFIGKMKK